MEGFHNNHSFPSNISEDAIRNLPKDQFNGKIFLIESPSQLEFLKSKLQKLNIIGFDTETRPSFKKGRKNKVSLVQLAIENEAFLIRINRVGFPEFLTTFFENGNIQKIGLAIRDDLNFLNKIRPFTPAGFIDLQQYVKQYNIADNGLKKLTANILGFRISKKQQTSNWDKEVLDEDQLIYAATDAWVCYKIYQTLQEHV